MGAKAPTKTEREIMKIKAQKQTAQDKAFAQAVKTLRKEIAKTKQAEKPKRIKCLHKTQPYIFYTESTHYRDVSCICDACSTLERNLHALEI